MRDGELVLRAGKKRFFRFLVHADTEPPARATRTAVD